MIRLNRAPVFLSVTILLNVFAFGEVAFASSNDYSKEIQLSVNRWLAVQKPSGFFPYGFDFLDDKELDSESMSAANLIRQVGTTAVLADYFAKTNDQRVLPAIQQLLTAIGQHSIPIGKSSMQKLVEKTRLLSMPFGRYKIQAAMKRLHLLYAKTGPGKVIALNTDYSKAYSGTVALALLAELRYAKSSGDTSFSRLRDAWLEGLIGFWIPGEGFRLSATSIDTTPYFDGQAWLALAEYARAFPQDHRVSEILADIDDALLEKYEERFVIDFFHWGTMAVAARYTDTKQIKFYDFIKTQMREFLDRKEKHTDSANCAAVEGMADALGSLLIGREGDSKLAVRAQEWINREMKKARQLQIQPGQTELVLSNSKIIAPRMQEFSGSFRAGIKAANTRVDFTAHCVSAMLKLQRNDGIYSGN